MTLETSKLETLDKERVLHPSTSIVDHLRTGPRIMTEGSGVMLTDSNGRRYLDAFAGLWCVNIGYGRTEVSDAIAAQSRRLGYYHTFSSMSNDSASKKSSPPLVLHIRASQRQSLSASNRASSK